MVRGAAEICSVDSRTGAGFPPDVRGAGSRVMLCLFLKSLSIGQAMFLPEFQNHESQNHELQKEV